MPEELLTAIHLPNLNVSFLKSNVKENKARLAYFLQEQECHFNKRENKSYSRTAFHLLGKHHHSAVSKKNFSSYKKSPVNKLLIYENNSELLTEEDEDVKFRLTGERTLEVIENVSAADSAIASELGWGSTDEEEEVLEIQTSFTRLDIDSKGKNLPWNTDPKMDISLESESSMFGGSEFLYETTASDQVKEIEILEISDDNISNQSVCDILETDLSKDPIKCYFKKNDEILEGKSEKNSTSSVEFERTNSPPAIVQNVKDGNICVISDVVGNADSVFSEDNKDLTSESLLITPKKTKDITKIKGWRRKQFFVEKPTTIEFFSYENCPASKRIKLSHDSIEELGENEIPENLENVFFCDSLDNFLEEEVQLKNSCEVPHLYAEVGIKLTSDDVLSTPNLSAEDIKNIGTRYCIPVPSILSEVIEGQVEEEKEEDNQKETKGEFDTYKRAKILDKKKQNLKFKTELKRKYLRLMTNSEEISETEKDTAEKKVISNLDSLKLTTKLIGLVVYPGLPRPMHTLVRLHLKKLRRCVTTIDSNWANFAASAVLSDKSNYKFKRSIIPVYCCGKFENSSKVLQIVKAKNSVTFVKTAQSAEKNEVVDVSNVIFNVKNSDICKKDTISGTENVPTDVNKTVTAKETTQNAVKNVVVIKKNFTTDKKNTVTVVKNAVTFNNNNNSNNISTDIKSALVDVTSTGSDEKKVRSVLKNTISDEKNFRSVLKTSVTDEKNVFSVVKNTNTAIVGKTSAVDSKKTVDSKAVVTCGSIKGIDDVEKTSNDIKNTVSEEKNIRSILKSTAVDKKNCSADAKNPVGFFKSTSTFNSNGVADIKNCNNMKNTVIVEINPTLDERNTVSVVKNAVTSNIKSISVFKNKFTDVKNSTNGEKKTKCDVKNSVIIEKNYAAETKTNSTVENAITDFKKTSIDQQKIGSRKKKDNSVVENKAIGAKNKDNIEENDTEIVKDIVGDAHGTFIYDQNANNNLKNTFTEIDKGIFIEKILSKNVINTNNYSKVASTSGKKVEILKSLKAPKVLKDEKNKSFKKELSPEVDNKNLFLDKKSVKVIDCKVVLKRIKFPETLPLWCMDHNCYSCKPCGLCRSKSGQSEEEQDAKENREPVDSSVDNFEKTLANLLAKKLRVLRQNGGTVASIDSLKTLKTNSVELVKLGYVQRSFLTDYIIIWYLEPQGSCLKSRAFLTFSKIPPMPNVINLKSAAITSTNIPKVITEIISSGHVFDANEYAILHCNGKVWEIYGCLNLTVKKNDIVFKKPSIVVDQIFSCSSLPELAELQKITFDNLHVKSAKWWILDLNQEFKEIEIKSDSAPLVITRSEILDYVKLKNFGFTSIRVKRAGRAFGAYIGQKLLPFVLIGPYHFQEQCNNLATKSGSSTVPFTYSEEESTSRDSPLKFFINSVITQFKGSTKKVKGLWLHDKSFVDNTSYIEVVFDSEVSIEKKISSSEIDHGYSFSSLSNSMSLSKDPYILKRWKEEKKFPKSVVVYLYFEFEDLGFVLGELQSDNSVIITHPLDSSTKIRSLNIGDWFIRVLRKKILFVPENLQIKWFVTKFREDLRDRQPFDKFYLGGAHMLCKSGVFFLLHMNEKKIGELELDKNRVMNAIAENKVLKEVNELKKLASLFPESSYTTNYGLSMAMLLEHAVDEISKLKNLQRIQKTIKTKIENKKNKLGELFLERLNSCNMNTKEKVRAIDGIISVFKNKNKSLCKTFLENLRSFTIGLHYIKRKQKLRRKIKRSKDPDFGLDQKDPNDIHTYDINELIENLETKLSTIFDILATKTGSLNSHKKLHLFNRLGFISRQLKSFRNHVEEQEDSDDAESNEISGSSKKLVGFKCHQSPSKKTRDKFSDRKSTITCSSQNLLLKSPKKTEVTANVQKSVHFKRYSKRKNKRRSR